MAKTWRPITGWERYYEISDLGNVRNSITGLILRPGINPKTGYRIVVLSRNGIRQTCAVHQLVLAAFVGPRPDGMESLHWDDDKANNALSNLRYGTRSENLHDAVRNGRHRGANQTECVNGHKYTPENTGRQTSGGRYCRQCLRDRNRCRKTSLEGTAHHV